MLADRLRSRYGISEHDVNTLTAVDAFVDIGLDGEGATDSLVRYFEQVAGDNVDGKTAINWYAYHALSNVLRYSLLKPFRVCSVGSRMNCSASWPIENKHSVPIEYQSPRCGRSLMQSSPKF